MLRRIVAAGLCGALQMGALAAPLVHAHLDDHHGDHHEARAVHAHVGGHPRAHHAVPRPPAADRDAAYVAAAEAEQVTRLQIFVAVAAPAFTTPALPPARFALVAAFESVMRHPPDVVRSHGPPFVPRSPSRAPPAFSV